MENDSFTSSESSVQVTNYKGNDDALMLGSDVLANAKVNFSRVGHAFRTAIRYDKDISNQSSS